MSEKLTAEDVRAAAEVHRELGPDYSDAVVESFLSRIDEHVEARVQQRLAQSLGRSDGIDPAPVRKSPRRVRQPVDPVRLSKQRIALASFAAGSVVVGAPLTVFAMIWHNAEYPVAPEYAGWILWLWVVLAAVCGVAAYRLRRR